jgi:glutamyl-tRNA synthetase
VPTAPRARFAPSPTGYLHVGSAQSALFNWLFARHTGGEMLLRIEDTDTERNRPELTDNILEMLEWLGIGWDGEPVHQSERLDAYRGAAARLFDSGAAYYCDCTPEEVQARARARGGTPGYDGHCRDRGLSFGPGRALRFRTPDDGVTAWDDLIRDKPTFENANLEDFVLLRSSGTPTFLLANVVDDADMQITHVIRGEDHVNGTPKYLLIRAALGLSEQPAFAHLPLLVNEQKKKLSKRRDDVSVADYRARGYLPEAMRNYLALLGWGPKDGIEIRPIEEIVQLFRLEDVTPSPAFFDLKKLRHINGEYIRALPVSDFVARGSAFLPSSPGAQQALSAMAPLVQERVHTLDQLPDNLDFLYLDEAPFDEAVFGKEVARVDGAAAVLDAVIDVLAADDTTWAPDALHSTIDAVAAAHGFENPRKVHAIVRVAVTGRKVGLPLFESLVALGRDRTIERLQAARVRL